MTQHIIKLSFTERHGANWFYCKCLFLKQQIISKIIKQFESELSVMAKAAQEAREAATHEESVAEDKYDTRGLEASYLAGAQARRVAELQWIIHSYQNLELLEFTSNSPIGITALVEVVSGKEKKLFFLAPKGGGILIEVDSLKVQIVAPDSKIGSELMGKTVGDVVEMPIMGRLKEYEILKIC